MATVDLTPGTATSLPAPSAPTVARHRVTDFEQWRVVTWHQIQHYLRTNRFFGLLAFVFAISALTLTLEVSAGVTVVQAQQLNSSMYLNNYLSWTGLWVILAAAFFGGDALSMDFSGGTGYYMLVLPIRRPTLLAGRYTAAALVTLSVVALYFAFATAGAAYFFGGLRNLPWSLLAESFGVAAVFTLATLSVAFTVSSFFRSPTAGVLVTVLVLYVAFTTLENVWEIAGLEPWFSLNYAGSAISTVFATNFTHYQLVPLGAAQSYAVWTATVSEGVGIMLGYLLVFLPLSAYIYHRRESTG